MNPSRESLEVVAYHEAGHAVAGIILELDYTESTIIPGSDYPGNDYKGRTDLDIENYMVSPFSSRRVRNALVALYAGIAAEEFFFGARSDLGRDDEERAEDILRQFCTRNAREISFGPRRKEDARGRSDALKLVGQHCEAVKRMALLLLDRQTVTREEVRMAMEE